MVKVKVISLRYDLNQILYNYIMEVRNTFKGLDLVDRVPEELRMEVCNSTRGCTCTCNSTRSKPSQRKGNAENQSGCLIRIYK